MRFDLKVGWRHWIECSLHSVNRVVHRRYKWDFQWTRSYAESFQQHCQIRRSGIFSLIKIYLVALAKLDLRDIIDCNFAQVKYDTKLHDLY